MAEDFDIELKDFDEEDYFIGLDLLIQRNLKYRPATVQMSDLLRTQI